MVGCHQSRTKCPCHVSHRSPIYSDPNQPGQVEKVEISRNSRGENRIFCVSVLCRCDCSVAQCLSWCILNVLADCEVMRPFVREKQICGTLFGSSQLTEAQAAGLKNGLAHAIDNELHRISR